ncbi:hypothetical protein KIN20_036099 [Parelaphostrongylus tenuis]|uniref:Uncharacterized protein n=1 Tax=Parelaphostrongylus tenuis TaxID=148309 RepID=A0AAD5RFM4_PARTN|nr:hypothetical protein KIN20_036099 [Parelaphostrongylus tenuis]
MLLWTNAVARGRCMKTTTTNEQLDDGRDLLWCESIRMNVPPYIIAQLEKANDVIRRQSEELDRFRFSDLLVETLLYEHS